MLQLWVHVMVWCLVLPAIPPEGAEQASRDREPSVLARLESSSPDERLKAMDELLNRIMSPPVQDSGRTLAKIMCMGLTEPDTRVRKRLREALPFLAKFTGSMTDQKAVVDKLVGGLASAEPATRRFAYQALLVMSRDALEAVPGVIRQLRFADEGQKVNLALLLAEIGPAPGSKPALMRLYSSESMGEASRAWIGVALARLDARKIIPQLAMSLSSSNAEARRASAIALGHFRVLSGEVIEKLVTATCDKRPEVRLEVFKTLSRTSTVPKGLVDALQSGLKDGSSMIRLATIETVASLRVSRKDLVEELATIVTSDEDIQLRVRAQRAITVSLEESAIPALTHVLKEGSFHLRRTAARLLADISCEGVRVLIQMTESGDVQVARAALHGLSRAGPYAETAGEALANAVDKRSLRYQVLVTITDLGPRAATPTLIRKMAAALLNQEEETLVRQQAAKALGVTGQIFPEAVQALRKAAQESDRDVADAARAALKDIPQ